MGQYCVARCRLSSSSVVVCNTHGRLAAVGLGWAEAGPAVDTARGGRTTTACFAGVTLDWFRREESLLIIKDVLNSFKPGMSPITTEIASYAMLL